MGKQLVIKDADFSSHYVEKLANLTDISDEIVKLSSVGYRQVIDFRSHNLEYAFQYSNTAISNDRYIAGIDVTNYRGREIIAVIFGMSKIDGVFYTFFASSLNVTIPWTSTSNQSNAFVSVQRIDGKGNPDGVDTFRLTVPETATYFIFNADSGRPGKIYLIDED